jgi:hypothetical protein
MPYKIPTPLRCPVCDSIWVGGAVRPGDPLTKGRVFYKCGCSISIKDMSDDHCLVLIKNCQGEYNALY